MKTKMISNLPVELLEEILSRLSMKSIVAVRSTCKNWNVLTKDQRFADKHIEKAAREKEVLVITGDTKDHFLNVKFYDFHNKTFEPSTKRNGILITQGNSDSKVFVCDVFYCNGLLLCELCNVKRRLLVWNPYWGTTRWIQCPTKRSYEVFAFGYDIINMMDSNSCFSLKGNTYWHCVYLEGGSLLCFDFTRERFGPPLLLPFPSSYGVNESLSLVKEDKLAVLLEPGDVFGIPVWITDKIEPDYVSWSKFFTIETSSLNCECILGSFLIEEEKKTVVVFKYSNTCYNIIDGESGDFRKVESSIEFPRLYNLVSNYVPSSVQI